MNSHLLLRTHRITLLFLTRTACHIRASLRLSSALRRTTPAHMRTVSPWFLTFRRELQLSSQRAPHTPLTQHQVPRSPLTRRAYDCLQLYSLTSCTSFSSATGAPHALQFPTARSPFSGLLPTSVSAGSPLLVSSCDKCTASMETNPRLCTTASAVPVVTNVYHP